MSEVTNQERLNQNNEKLEAISTKITTIKQKVDNLPKYAGVQPIYAPDDGPLVFTSKSDAPFSDIQQKYQNGIRYSRLDDYLMISNNEDGSKYTMYLYKIIDSNYQNIKTITGNTIVPAFMGKNEDYLFILTGSNVITAISLIDYSTEQITIPREDTYMDFVSVPQTNIIYSYYFNSNARKYYYRYYVYKLPEKGYENIEIKKRL